MASLSETRERLCHAIASLSSNAAMDDICRALDPILESFQRENSLTEFHDDDDDGGIIVTPLMVACDKAQEACIEWISNKNRHCPHMTSILGGPLDHAESGNAPMHYASSAGCLPAINLLCGMLDDDETDRLRSLASQRNDNYDTPIILAAFRGHVAFLRQMHVLLREENGREATRPFELSNADGHTALSLSCGHGHVEVVNFLVGEVGVAVTYEIVKQAEKTLKQIDEALDRTTMTKEHRARRNDVSRCVVILKVSLAKSAQASMEQLLAEEDNERERKAAKGQTPKNKKPKRTEKRRVLSADRDTPLNINPAMIATASKDDNSDSGSDIGTSNDENQSHITVKAHQDANQSTRVDDVDSEEVADAQTETDNNSLSDGPTMNDVDVDLDVDAIIEALCLDASMLLLNSRDMAATLSPCQLDALAAILRNQIQAVNEARMIQAHLRSQAD